MSADHVDWAVEREDRVDAHQMEQLAGLMLSLTTKMQHLEEVGFMNFRLGSSFHLFYHFPRDAFFLKN